MICEIPNEDYESLTNNLVNKLRDYAGSKKAVCGVSGGVDSAVVAYLCARALGRDSVLGLLAPWSSEAEGVVNALRVNFDVLDINPLIESYKQVLSGKIDLSDKLVIGNIKSRARMTLFYSYANSINGLVIGTSNKTELAIGYFTKYGDGGVDVEPIGDLVKGEVYGIAQLGVNEGVLPDYVLETAPSAGLWVGQTDESDIGMTYSLMDKMVLGLIPPSDEFTKRVTSTEHKRGMPAIFSKR